MRNVNTNHIVQNISSKECYKILSNKTDSYLIETNIVLDSTNIVKLQRRGLYNYKNKTLGDLYIIIIPDVSSKLMPDIKDGIKIIKSHKW